MPKFTAPPPNGDSRKALQERSREATRPAIPEKRSSWPFCATDAPSDHDHEASPSARSGQTHKTA